MREIKTTSRNSYILGDGVKTSQIRTDLNEVIDLSVKDSKIVATLKGKTLKLSSNLKKHPSITDILTGKMAGRFTLKDGILDFIEVRHKEGRLGMGTCAADTSRGNCLECGGNCVVCGGDCPCLAR